MNDLIEQKLKQLPSAPGVYIMKDAAKRIIYVGKAVILKNRVRQYFQSNKNHSAKVIAMVKKIADFETIITGSEIEALILECNLIKKHHPRYNISLRDDKTYPYLKITLKEDFPRVLITRRIKKDGSRYFGPYTNVGAMKESLKLLRRSFPLRTCKNMNVDRPCLEYHIKRCMAPCVGKIGKKTYGEMVKSVLLFLEGKSDILEKVLYQRMEKAAENFQFELAASLRDQLAAIKKTTEKQKIMTYGKDQDAVGMARSIYGVCMQVFYIRGGKMIGRNHFILKNIENESDIAVMTAFFKQYYNQASSLPQEVLLPIKIYDGLLMEQWLTAVKGKKIDIIIPQRGLKKDLVNMAAENAAKFLKDEEERIMKENAQTMGAVKELGKYLHLARLPRRMECFDISHIQGSETVASMVVFEDGLPDKSSYRRFKIKSTEGKPDDFLSMREVTKRRYEKVDADDMPDLIIIDGGKGQLSSALEIIRGAGHMMVPVVGLAKQFEYIFTEGESEPVILPRHSEALYLVQRIRDEAHRFAITYHRKLRGKRNMVSILDHIDGIGPKRRRILWEHFGRLDKIKEADVAQLAAVKGMTKSAAQAVYNFFAAQESFVTKNNIK
ncbi:excinuclease ABC subunit UvrC [Pectinatus sottacetonis]|uniref:excinuclease ABC subunit UvrC n=1 Tax=Pectinatus sottacetonis TaxID=1002795 RepID=UPI001E5423AE|nr:excinuclease ABC subunit UvrC [Pectinatus sottacetonis]